MRQLPAVVPSDIAPMDRAIQLPLKLKKRHHAGVDRVRKWVNHRPGVGYLRPTKRGRAIMAGWQLRIETRPITGGFSLGTGSVSKPSVDSKVKLKFHRLEWSEDRRPRVGGGVVRCVPGARLCDPQLGPIVQAAPGQFESCLISEAAAGRRPALQRDLPGCELTTASFQFPS